MIPTEDELADLIERLIGAEMAVTPGLRERHDAQSGRLRVDFVYPEANPEPLAVEITSIQWEDMRAQESNLRGLREQLTESARSLGAGFWRLHTEGRRWTRAECETVKAWVLSSLEAGHETTPNVPVELTEIGVLELVPEPGSEDRVAFSSMTGLVGIDGFSMKLLQVAASNASKLKEARPRQTHLVVYVEFLEGSRDSDLTLPPPAIPATDGIDYIWVVFGSMPTRADPRPWVWWAALGDSQWKTVAGHLDGSA